MMKNSQNDNVNELIFSFLKKIKDNQGWQTIFAYLIIHFAFIQ